MSPDDEELVERYVRYPESLSGHDRDRVGSLLRTDTTARQIADFYRRFYDELDAVEGPDDSGDQRPGNSGRA
jgi:hypothetical protein